MLTFCERIFRINPSKPICGCFLRYWILQKWYNKVQMVRIMRSGECHCQLNLDELDEVRHWWHISTITIIEVMLSDLECDKCFPPQAYFQSQCALDLVLSDDSLTQLNIENYWACSRLDQTLLIVSYGPLIRLRSTSAKEILLLVWMRVLQSVSSGYPIPLHLKRHSTRHRYICDSSSER